MTPMEAVRNSKVIYEFGKFVLDPGERLLLYEDQPIRLRAKEFDTLLLFLVNNGKAISKEEMMSVLWQGTFVEEGNLVKQVSRLRKILNTSGAELIQTIPKYGYRFSAKVNRVFKPDGEPDLECNVTSVPDRYGQVPDAPDPALPRKRDAFSRLAVVAVVAFLVLSGAAFVWFWRDTKQAAKADDDGFVILTDASHEDNSAYWVGENKIYFSRKVSAARLETWRMNADGSDQHRANREIKNLLYGRWSPDGKKVVFVKEGDNRSFYLADSNGGNEIVLPFSGGNMDWSPDGSQIVYQSAKNEKGNHQVFLYTLATGKNVSLTNGNLGNADPSFSPDGKQIAFTSFQDGNVDVYVMDADGSNVRRVTDHPAFDNYPVFSPDGTQIAFQSNRENERTEVYVQDLEGVSPPVKIASTNGETGIHPKCWSADGTQILFWTNQNGKSQIVSSNIEPYPAEIVLSDERADLRFPRSSSDGKQLLYQARSAGDQGIELRVTDLENQKTRTIFKSDFAYGPNYLLSPSWSPDGRQIVFNDKSGGNSEAFIINTDGSGLQNLTNDPLPDTAPVFSPDSSEIVFTRDFYGEAQLYRMNPDGSNPRRVTEKKGHELGAAFSPDGRNLAFSVDRMNADSRGLDICLLDLNDPGNEKRLTALRFHESFPTFSPDGKRIAFVGNADGNAEIYLMNTDGTGLIRLTRSKWQESAPQFAPDGTKLIFAADRNGKFAIYEMELP